MMHVLSAQQFDPDMLEGVFETADDMRDLDATADGRRELVDMHRGTRAATVFYEPSTRTRLSFEGAAEALGVAVLGTENAKEYSSAAKGETTEDTLRSIGAFAHLIIARHDKTGELTRAAWASPVPIINGGDGKGEHPSQAVLDAYTIKRETGRNEDLTLVVGGDLAHGRTARSLVLMQSHWPGNRFVFVSSPDYQMGDDIKSHLDEKGAPYEETDNMHDALREADVVYWTRLQRERLTDPRLAEKAELIRRALRSVTEVRVPRDVRTELQDLGIDLAGVYKDFIGSAADRWIEEQARLLKRVEQDPSFVIDQAALQSMKPDAVLMHPLPRVGEIDPSVDSDPRAAYFRQVENGLYSRMALIDMLLKSSL